MVMKLRKFFNIMHIWGMGRSESISNWSRTHTNRNVRMENSNWFCDAPFIKEIQMNLIG